MSWLTSFLGWLGEFFGDPANWSGPGGIPARLTEHLEFSALALALAVLVAVPVGLAIGHTGRGQLVVVVAANLARALPTLGVLVLFVLLLGTSSIWPVIIPLVLLAVPPILVNTYEGIRGVEPELRDAAYGMGLRGGQVLGQVLVPVALPLILLGLRLSAIQVVATTTVAAYTGLGGLGRYVIDGFATKDYSSVVGGSVLIVAFALVVQAAFTLVQRVTVSPGVSRRLKVRQPPARKENSR
ncbi:ABC transporter permease [Nonomuraea pusilla]|uniref:Osmoprotectant transport system permease protein n=1 Tax=Nonomuraea pusilla TaxID=46177 RepID=A0A1H8BXU0_9ACTN|nr:ABC transporter permease subunit [Nonomuraea pusilla]SEM87680.1 osmoprotectant transport system permease protein [Nonomuraea pusilla]